MTDEKALQPSLTAETEEGCDARAADARAIESTYRHIPRAVIQYMCEIAGSGVPCQVTTALRDHPSKTLRRLDRLFEQVGAILGETDDKLLAMTDWDPRDKEPTRFDAMLAELRTVRFLDEEGFHEIMLLPSRRAERADGTARRGAARYAFEVVCPNRDHFRWPGHSVRRQDLVDYVVERFRAKKSQLETTAEEEDCQTVVLVSVLVEEGVNALMDQEEFRNDVLEPAWRLLGEPLHTHVVIIGKWRADHTVFPAWTS